MVRYSLRIIVYVSQNFPYKYLFIRLERTL